MPGQQPADQLLVCIAAGGFSDSSVRMYDLEKMAAARSQEEAAGSAVSLLWGHSAAVYGLDYSPDQQLLFTSSADGTVRLWSTELAANLVAYRSHTYTLSHTYTHTLILSRSVTLSHALTLTLYDPWLSCSFLVVPFASLSVLAG